MVVSAPTALKAHNVAEGKTITSYPAMRVQLEEGGKLDGKHLQHFCKSQLLVCNWSKKNSF